MNTATLLADRLQEVFLDGTWVAKTNFQDQLRGVDLTMAMTEVGELNTIAKLVYHNNYYLDGLLKVLHGEPLNLSDKYSFDLSTMKSDDDWENLVATFLQNAQAFVDKVRTMSEDEIKGPFVADQYGTYLRNLDGVIEHAYYHLGQIVILKKMIQPDS